MVEVQVVDKHKILKYKTKATAVHSFHVYFFTIYNLWFRVGRYIGINTFKCLSKAFSLCIPMISF